MIFKTAYETTACGGFQIKRTVEALQEAHIYGSLTLVPNTRIMLVQSQDAASNAVPAFAHPLQYEHNKEQWLALDVRGFGNWSQTQHEFVVRNTIEYNLNVSRAKLNEIWLDQTRFMSLRDVSVIPMAIYAAWISEGLARRFALDPMEQFKLAVLSAVFYLGLFLPAGDELSESDKIKMAQTIAKGIRAKAEDVLEMLDSMQRPPRNVAELCTMAEEMTQSVRLKDLSAGLLISIVAGTWYGTNAKEMAAVALEHPPTWLAILMAAFSERSYKNSSITKLSERIASKNAGSDFMRAIFNLLMVYFDAH